MLRTPLRRSAWLSAASGTDVFLKLETLQPTFSYKIRGALNAVLRLLEGTAGAVPPLVTASAGNHGRALAHAAREAGLRLTVYVAETAPRNKLDAIRQAGAELRPCRNYDEAERRAKEHGATGDALFISPYSHPDVIAGAGTIALEIIDEQADIDTFIVPIGGGGLISGVGIAAETIGALVVGVEVEASNPFTRSLSAGRIVEIDVGPTLADGLAGNMDPETITFDLVKRYVRRIVLVGESQLGSAIGAILREERLVAEGAAATGVAAVVSGDVDLTGRRVAVILSGANIDPAKLCALVSSA